MVMMWLEVRCIGHNVGKCLKIDKNRKIGNFGVNFVFNFC